MQSQPQRLLQILVLPLLSLSAALAVLLPLALKRENILSETVVLWAPNLPPRPVFLPRKATQELREAALFYAEAVEHISGQRPAIFTEVPGQQTRGVYLGDTWYSRQQRATLQAPAGEYWAARAVLRDSISYIASDTTTLQLALTREFWKMGYRHYQPGPTGLVYQPMPTKSIQRRQTIYIPQMQSRSLRGRWDTPAEKAWTRRLFDHRHHRFSHNLFRIITPADYANHPDWFPLQNGKHLQPAANPNRSYQPDLEHPGVIDRTIQYIRQYFRDNPSAQMVALGLNDNLQFGAQAWQSPRIDSQRYFRGEPDFSDYVYHFYNTVAGQLANEFPDKKIGVLAYSWWLNHPSFPLHPMLYPYICEDRSLWNDDLWQTQGIQLLSQYSHNGTRPIGIYDYWYGDASSYIIPRLNLPAQQLIINNAASCNIRGFHAEIDPIWEYDTAKVALLQELVMLAKGEIPDTAAMLNRIYADLEAHGLANRQRDSAWQAIWRDQPGKRYWLKYYKNEAQLSLFPPDALARMPQPQPPFLLAASQLYAAKLLTTKQPSASATMAPLTATLQNALANGHPHSNLPLAYTIFKSDPTMRWQPTSNIGPGNLLRNPSLESSISQATNDNPFTPPDQWNHWRVQSRPAQLLQISPSTKAARSGTHGLHITGSNITTLAQIAPVLSDLPHQAIIHARGIISGGSNLSLQIGWRDAQGKLLTQSPSYRLYPGQYPQWTPLVVTDLVPADAAYAQLGITISQQEPGDYLHLDDASLHIVHLPAANSR